VEVCAPHARDNFFRNAMRLTCFVQFRFSGETVPLDFAYQRKSAVLVEFRGLGIDGRLRCDDRVWALSELLRMFFTKTTVDNNRFSYLIYRTDKNISFENRWKIAKKRCLYVFLNRFETFKRT